MVATHQLSEIWENDFGKEYTDRNLQNVEENIQLKKVFWSALFSLTQDVKSVLEFGCNAGVNLEAIKTTHPEINVTGIEPNEYARKVATERAKGRYEIVAGSTHDFPKNLKADLTFTAGVLIHVAPENHRSAMKGVFDASNKYVLCMEYYWPETKQINYRGHEDALWKADFGGNWLREFPVKIVDTGYLGARDGFDRLTWWLFEKK